MVRSSTCPICQRRLPAATVESSFFPFCSERCRNVDLFRWSRGKYAIVEPLSPDQLQTELEQRRGGLDPDGLDELD